MKEISIHDVEGFMIGNAQNEEAATGCTAILCKKGAVGGVDVRGGSPGTRETDLLDPRNLVEEVHGVFLAGGSAFGLDVGSGLMEYLEEQQAGFDVQVARVPIVTGAILFDLYPGDASVRPDQKMGYEACKNAEIREKLDGSKGAGCGATVGKCLGFDYAMKGGLGTFAVQAGDLKIGAVVAVNGFGDIIDPNTGKRLAGVYDRENQTFLQSEQMLLNQMDNQTNRFQGNTTIGVVITNARMHKGQASKLASIAHDGLARTMRPSHTFVDGDTIFALSTSQVETDLNVVGYLAAHVMEQAVIKGIKEAKGIHDIPSFKDIHP